MSAWTYILKCSDGSYYTGCTTNWDQRWAQHTGGNYDGYTAVRRPLQLVWIEEFQEVNQAIDSERRIKRWSRPKKEALIGRDWDRLQRLAKNRQYHQKPE
ncbi:MAG: GIY-YIG nuclease family protein [Caulobacteraceae bacterium]